MLRRTTYHFLSLLILSLWVISCQTTPDSVVQTLSLVEKCMEVAPDSALNLLKRIPNPDVLHGKAQADYSLLMTQAMDKNYIKPESDSLIAIAVGYYGSHDENWIAKGKAFFYYGRVMKELNCKLFSSLHVCSVPSVMSDFCDPMDPSVSSVHGILQARILEWVSMSFYRGSS